MAPDPGPLSHPPAAVPAHVRPRMHCRQTPRACLLRSGCRRHEQLLYSSGSHEAALPVHHEDRLRQVQSHGRRSACSARHRLSTPGLTCCQRALRGLGAGRHEAHPPWAGWCRQRRPPPTHHETHARRLYQSGSSVNVGCSPDGYPTSQYLACNKDKYLVLREDGDRIPDTCASAAVRPGRGAAAAILSFTLFCFAFVI